MTTDRAANGFTKKTCQRNTEIPSGASIDGIRRTHIGRKYGFLLRNALEFSLGVLGSGNAKIRVYAIFTERQDRPGHRIGPRNRARHRLAARRSGRLDYAERHRSRTAV